MLSIRNGPMLKAIANTAVTLSMDGWSDVKNDPTLGYGVTTAGRSWLLDLEGTLGEHHTIENMVPLVQKKMKELEALNCTVGTFVVWGIFIQKLKEIDQVQQSLLEGPPG